MIDALVESGDIGARYISRIAGKRSGFKAAPSLVSGDTTRPEDNIRTEKRGIDPWAKLVNQGVIDDAIGKCQESGRARRVPRLRHIDEDSRDRIIASTFESGAQSLRESLAELTRNTVFKARRKEIISFRTSAGCGLQVQRINHVFKYVGHGGYFVVSQVAVPSAMVDRRPTWLASLPMAREYEASRDGAGRFSCAYSVVFHP